MIRPDTIRFHELIRKREHDDAVEFIESIDSAEKLAELEQLFEQYGEDLRNRNEIDIEEHSDLQIGIFYVIWEMLEIPPEEALTA